MNATLSISTLLGDNYGVDSHHAGKFLSLGAKLVREAMVGSGDLVGYFGLFYQTEYAFFALVNLDDISELFGHAFLLLADA